MKYLLSTSIIDTHLGFVLLNCNPEEIIALFIPITMLIIVGLVFILYFRYRNSVQLKMAEKGMNPYAKPMESLRENIDYKEWKKIEKNRNFRRGIILVSIGLGIIIGNIIKGWFDAKEGFVIVAAVVFCLGVAYLFYGYKISKE